MPMTDEELEHYFARIELPGVARAVVRSARKADPLRTVQGKGGNIYGRVASAKMEGPIQVESRTAEHAGVQSYEYDDDVLEFWDQAVSARLRHGRHVFDMLVLRADGVVLENWKTSSEVATSVANGDARFVLDLDGSYSWPEVDQLAAKIGLQHRLRLDTDIGARALENLRHIGPYLRGHYQRNPCLADALHAYLLAHPGHSVARVLADPEFAGSADDITFLIATGEVFTNILKENLGDGSARLYPSRAVAEAVADRLEPHPAPALVHLAPGTRLELDGRAVEVVHCGVSVVILQGEEGDVELPLAKVEEYVASGLLRGLDPLSRDLSLNSARATPIALAMAEARADAIWRVNRKLETAVSKRTLRRWAKLLRDGELTGRAKSDLLLPAPRPGRGRQLPDHVEEVLTEEIEREYETVASPSKKNIFDRIRSRLPEHEVPGRTTVYERIRARNAYKQALRRGGKRVAYELKPQFAYLELGTPVHGERPFEVAHADHTQMDVEIVDHETGLNLGRPWLTLLVDAYTRRILAFWITFDPPSRIAVLAVLRICAQRFGRLPESIVVDGGKEFGSRDVETFCTEYEITILRREGDPHSGSLIERMFGTTNTAFLHYLAGNTKIMKNVRQVTKRMNPAGHAVWDLLNLARALAWFLYEVYDARPHPAHHVSPRDAYIARLALSGDRPHRFVRPDADFVMRTLPSTPKGTATVDASRGVTVNNERYRCAAFGLPGVRRTAGRRTAVRVVYDPMDARHIYAYVKGQWHECLSRRLAWLGAFSTDELAAMSEREKAQPRAFERSRAASDREQGVFLLEIRATEEGLKRQRRGIANRVTAAFLPAPFGLPDQGSGRTFATAQGEVEDTLSTVVSPMSLPSLYMPVPNGLDAREQEPMTSRFTATLPRLLEPAEDPALIRAGALARPVTTLEDF